MSEMPCSICKQPGHNRRTCSTVKLGEDTSSETDNLTHTHTVPTKTFRERMCELLAYVNANPSILESTAHKEMKTRLDKSCGKGQGLGNKCSDQEACFAVVCETHGVFQFHPGGTDNGVFYKYQASGTQRAIDFRILEVKDGKIVDSIDLDLKHSSSDSIFLNDGTFLDDVVYVISFTRLLERIKGQRKCPRESVCVIAMGQNVMSPKDKLALERRFAQLKEINSVKEDLDHLTMYVRNANQFSCKKFTPEETAMSLEKTRAWLGSFARPIEPEPHSRLA